MVKNYNEIDVPDFFKEWSKTNKNAPVKRESKLKKYLYYFVAFIGVTAFLVGSMMFIAFIEMM